MIQVRVQIAAVAMQLTEFCGTRIAATSSTDEKMNRVDQVSVDELQDYARTPAGHRRVLEIAGGEGIHVPVDVFEQGTLVQRAAVARIGDRISQVTMVSRLPDARGEVLFARAVTAFHPYGRPPILRPDEHGDRQMSSRAYGQRYIRFRRRTALAGAVNKSVSLRKRARAHQLNRRECRNGTRESESDRKT